MSATKNDATKISIDAPNGQTFDFEITRANYNSYQDALALPGKTKAMHNFIVQSATKECRTELVQFIDDNPGSEFGLMAVINKEYVPDLEFTVKK